MTACAPNTPPNIDEFFDSLALARKRVLLLDYDGTLAPFRVDPAEAEPYPGVREQLDAIMDDPHTRLIIVSGRWTKDLLPLLKLRRQPELWGSHGAEQLRPDGAYAAAAVDEAALRALVALDEQCGEIVRLGGRCERKPGSFAVHWRGDAPAQIERLRAHLQEFWNERALAQYLRWQDFDGGVEFRVPGHHKGNVIDTVLAREGHCVAAFLGDDLTDENGFIAIKGRGLGILVRTQYRSTDADAWLRPPEQLLEFLSRWRHACAQEN